MRSPGHGDNRGDVIQDGCSLAPAACLRARELGNTPGRRRLHRLESTLRIGRKNHLCLYRTQFKEYKIRLMRAFMASSPQYGCRPGSPGYSKPERFS